MIVVRCKDCNRELTSNSPKYQCCGCSNMMTVRGDSVSAVDLSRVVMVNSDQNNQKKNFLTAQDIAWQEERKKRKVRRLDFEIR